MKRILIRSGMTPWDKYEVEQVFQKNAFGDNVGNLIYAYSVYRNLMTEDVILESDYYGQNPDNADMINEKYDAYVFPLANAFRASFMPTLKNYTKLIKRLKIPVYVIGVGMNAPYEPNLKNGFEFDETVREFVKAVLEKSNILGLRGQITSDYLTYLGFKEGRDHQVIGCPSMYGFGGKLKIKDVNLNAGSIISTNISPSANQNTIDFIHNLFDKYDNCTFIPQDNDELLLTYAGNAYANGATIALNKPNYPNRMEAKEFSEGKVEFFLNAHSWFSAMKKADFSIGTRLHGNVVPTLMGVPSLVIPIDARMRELSEYHDFARIEPKHIKSDDTLESIISQVDFKAVERKQEKNFNNFVNFLDKNNISHLYTKNHDDDFIHPFDRKMEQMDLADSVVPLSSINDKGEILRRVGSGLELAANRNKKITGKLSNTIKKQKARINELKKSKAISTDVKKDEVLLKKIEELEGKVSIQEKIISKLVE